VTSPLGESKAGIETIDEAFGLIAETNERWNEAELHLRKGELLLQLSEAEGAETSFQRALEVAREQNTKLWELRAATSLAQYWRERGRHNVARDILAPIYSWFTEGFETSDLKSAETLLNELSRASPR
jgi:predicted ATPase